MTGSKSIAHNVSKFKRSKCKNCKSIFPWSNAIYIQADDNIETYCSKNCLPEYDNEILNCSVCNLIVEQSSIFCMVCTTWVHQKCSKLTDNDLETLSTADDI